MRSKIAILAGMIGNKVVQMAGRKGTSLTGKIALAVKPDILNDFAKKCDKIALITGTNGKTTTNNLMASALEAKGYKVICNKLGANMLSGVATTVLQEMNIFGKLKADYACLEIDEAYTPIVFDYVKPDVMVITNLFRDQLDRYG